MPQVTVEQATQRLDELVDAAARGEEVVLVRGDRAVARLVSVSNGGTRPCPRFGSARGLIQMADDFDAPMEDFREYME
jgi:antitoxin (DNA-binding transcriptional repressor) of toxin-antitoxin stability system